MTQRRLSVLLLLFFVSLTLPSSILVYQAYRQLKWEAFYQQQRLARELTLRIDSGFRELIAREDKRPISDYEFLNVTGSGSSAFLQRSPLSQYPPQSEVPGLIGYFQIDASGRLRTPLVPGSNAPSYGISSAELKQRQLLEGRIRGILDRNRLVEKSTRQPRGIVGEAEAKTEADATSMYSIAAGANLSKEGDDRADEPQRSQDALQLQSTFDELSSARTPQEEQAPIAADQLEDLKLDDSYNIANEAGAAVPAPQAASQDIAKRSRKEKVNLPQSIPSAAPAAGKSALADREAGAAEPGGAQQNIRIETFESEVEPMKFAELDSGQFVLFRSVWRDRARQVQGLLIDQDEFIGRLVTPAFRESGLASMSRLIVVYRGDVLQSLEPESGRDYRPGTEQASDELLYQARMVAPFGDIELIYALARLPIGAGGRVVIWSALVLALVLVVGCFMLLRLGRRQLALARQQQDFVSAVSHELKTPLTSIRMYGEMLREGWVDEGKRKTYYDFIFHEAERLTRLINNVLQLARLSRSEQPASLVATTVGAALAELRPRLESQLEPTGFELSIDGEADADTLSIEIDIDGFLQIFINLVDNAVKFSANAERRCVDIGYRRLRDGRIQFSVRDYGPGIAADQMKKIFTLFYRSENELTRETIGTGIGLALVQQLASSMGAEVDVVNCDPGAEFRIQFPATG